MTMYSGTSRTSLYSTFRWLAFVPALLCAMAVIATPSMQAQTLHVLYALTDRVGGVLSGLTLDRAGNLYGTTYYGSPESVFELRHERSSWLFQPLYYFHPQNDGHAPFAPVIFGPDGALYGTTIQGGELPFCYYQLGPCGTVFSVQPSPNPCGSTVCLWNETRVHWIGGFQNSNDGSSPFSGPLIFDSAGNIYGTTDFGGALWPGNGLSTGQDPEWMDGTHYRQLQGKRLRKHEFRTHFRLGWKSLRNDLAWQGRTARYTS